MKKNFFLFLFLLMSVFANTTWGQILVDESGAKYLTIGSTKDEVLEILGTPEKIDAYFDRWYYGSNSLSFDEDKRIKEYTNAKALKILLIPSNRNNCKEDSEKILNSQSSSKNNSYSNSANGYGEISKTTGRARTNYVNGYYRKNGTYVKPYYRS
ncbi:hypothetical protein [Estrella lausannensis]|uniref:Putative outer membrane lipoprotein n=1 Tax=Estrella lausannensis TaxID=483423 RepID=A0A0H5DNT9_9BACT|nr:hypothetical protein [Estrella lausannensis]CRX37967.1 Putative outer membrane lipoprotein [Estrella lausannensis]